MTAEEELALLLAQLRDAHDVLPFLDRQISAADAVFRPLPDEMVDIIAASPDFRLPVRGGEPVWLQLESDGERAAELVVVRPAADGELWAIAPVAETGTVCDGD